jgi:hypothetical protein
VGSVTRRDRLLQGQSDRLELDNEIKDLEDETSEAEEAFDTIDLESGLRIKFWKATFR